MHERDLYFLKMTEYEIMNKKTSSENHALREELSEIQKKCQRFQFEKTEVYH